ncbi:unnamed protein product [Candidula unifasciata]|uniref:RecA family profile 1 domain-containing protein n=1 Tax=Candidula unifasciata TaxID=100452 RepID=A0A8S3Z9E3_9EUPU|nr:unnamed protein product [Candidula unifasciata]
MSLHESETVGSLDLDPKITGMLKKAHLTNLRHIMTLSNLEIERLANLPVKDVQMIKDLVAEKLVRKPVTALEILHKKTDVCLQHWRLGTNCQVIDSVLRGGLLSGVVSEISGESACGKTQLCLQLCISVQLNNICSGGAVYICTEDAFPSKRLQHLIQANSAITGGRNLGDQIFIEHVADFETLDFCISRKLPTLLERELVKLVVIDSVTALFRCHYDATQTVERAKHLTSFASKLRQLAFVHRIPVVCVNQVSANMSGAGDASTVPALGLTWANQIACRITMSRPSVLPPSVQKHKMEWKGKPGALAEATYRKLAVVFAPHLPLRELFVFIDHCGIHGLV